MSVSCADPVPDEYAELSDQANMYCIIGQQGIRPHALRPENKWLFGIILKEDYLTGFITFMDTTGHYWHLQDPLAVWDALKRKLPSRPSSYFDFLAVMFRNTRSNCLGVKGTIMRVSFHGHCSKEKARKLQDRNPANANGLLI